MNNFLRILSFIVLLSAAPLSRAQVTIMVTANAEATTAGYTLGNTYTFIFTTGNFTTLANSTFSPTAWEWKEEQTTDDQLWASVTGTGLLGTFVQPTGNLNDPYSYIGAFSSAPQKFEVGAATDAIVTNTTGLTTLSGLNLREVSMSVSGGTLPTFTYSGSSPSTDLTTYYSNFVGTYTGFTGMQLELIDTSAALILTFDITSVQISAVPEPTTTALLSFGALGLLIIRRRRPTA